MRGRIHGFHICSCPRACIAQHCAALRGGWRHMREHAGIAEPLLKEAPQSRNAVATTHVGSWARGLLVGWPGAPAGRLTGPPIPTPRPTRPPMHNGPAHTLMQSHTQLSRRCVLWPALRPCHPSPHGAGVGGVIVGGAVIHLWKATRGSGDRAVSGAVFLLEPQG